MACSAKRLMFPFPFFLFPLCFLIFPHAVDTYGPPLSPTSYDTYQVVFEDVGQVATSVSYLHVAIDLHLPDIKKALDAYYKIMYDTLRGAQPYKIPLPQDIPRTVELWNRVLVNFTADFKDLEHQFYTRYKILHERYTHIAKVIPQTTRQQTQDYLADSERFRRSSRKKRALPLVLLKGVVGTLMGLYNRYQIKKLRDSLDSTIREQRRLLVTTAEHDKRISQLEKDYAYLPTIVKQTSFMVPMKVLVRLLEIELMIEADLNRIVQAVQQAQHRRLAVSTLSDAKLNAAFERITRRARDLRLDLLIDRPSDLFQIEVSYFCDGQDISLLLHVPMAAPNSRLRLQRFLPFPLSFTDSHFLLPRPEKTLFAISSSEPRLSLELNEADLEGCYRLNSLHLCERLGVLSRTTDNTCLGALYTQNFAQAINLCRMDLITPSERVLQLGHNRYLVYATHSFPAHITCRNSSANEHHFRPGINRVHVSPSCSLTLQEHVIFADSALQMDNQIREITWSAHELQLGAGDVLETEESLAAAAEDGLHNPTLADVRRRTGHRRRRIGWTLFFVLLGLVILAIALAWIFGFISTHKWWLLKKSVKMVHAQVSAAVSRFAHERFERAVRSNPPPLISAATDSGYGPPAPDCPTYSGSSRPPTPPARQQPGRRRRHRLVRAIFARRRPLVPTHRDLAIALRQMHQDPPLAPIT